jgi:hypothetical protein
MIIAPSVKMALIEGIVELQKFENLEVHCKNKNIGSQIENRPKL